MYVFIRSSYSKSWPHIIWSIYKILILDQIETASYNIKTIFGDDEQMTFLYDKYKLISKWDNIILSIDLYLEKCLDEIIYECLVFENFWIRIWLSDAQGVNRLCWFQV